jgi:hypothetical protein
MMDTLKPNKPYSLEHVFIEPGGGKDKCWFCGEPYKMHKPNDRTSVKKVQEKANGLH